jgi:hypothetical protein
MQSLHGRRLRGLAALLVLAATTGCQREWYRQQADEEVACLIAEKSYGNWDIGYEGVDPDPRSRYFDPYDPVRPPMPEDDPFSHEFMHSVDGKEGWAHWHDNGSVSDLQNPDWKMQLASYATTDENGVIRLNLEDALRIAIINSPDYQQQIEELYLSAIDVSTERFSFDTQFFAGLGRGRNDSTSFELNGSRFNRIAGNDNAALNIGSSGSLRRNLAAAGQITVEAFNSFTFGYAGGDTYASLGGLGFTFMQPLLRAGGRQIALERLTIVERTLLANLRAFQHYRQGFYTDHDVAAVSRVARASPGLLAREPAALAVSELPRASAAGSAEAAEEAAEEPQSEPASLVVEPVRWAALSDCSRLASRFAIPRQASGHSSRHSNFWKQHWTPA